MSMAEAAGGAGATEPLTGEDMADDEPVEMEADEEQDEDAAMAQALAMSMEGAGNTGPSAAGDGAPANADGQDELDPAFLQEVLQNLDPEVDADAVMKQREEGK